MLIMKNDKGQIFVEAVLSMIVLLVLFFAIFEIALLLRDAVYVNRIARETAREAAITADISAGEAKGRYLSDLYFKGKNVNITTKIDGNVVVVRVKMRHVFFGDFTKRLFNGGGVDIGGEAIYPWHDNT